jgi:hypothetical protein
VYVHYYPASGIPPPWVAISLLAIMLNYLVTHAMEMPSMARIGAVFLSVFSAFMFITRGGVIYRDVGPGRLSHLRLLFAGMGPHRVSDDRRFQCRLDPGEADRELVPGTSSSDRMPV